MPQKVLGSKAGIPHDGGMTTPTSKKMLWAGYVMTALPVLLLLFSAVMKFLKPPAVVAGMAHSGLQESILFKLGVLEVACTVVYLIPRTAVLGAILLTGYFGGAILATVRVGDSFAAPLLAGVLVWGGLYMRDQRVRDLIPLRAAG